MLSAVCKMSQQNSKKRVLRVRLRQKGRCSFLRRAHWCRLTPPLQQQGKAACSSQKSMLFLATWRAQPPLHFLTSHNQRTTANCSKGSLLQACSSFPQLSCCSSLAD